MAKLVLSANGNLVNQYFLDQPLLRIGRGADNEIIIDDPEVREHHASIRCVGDDHILSAEGDADDLSINGRPTGRRCASAGWYATFSRRSSAPARPWTTPMCSVASAASSTFCG